MNNFKEWIVTNEKNVLKESIFNYLKNKLNLFNIKKNLDDDSIRKMITRGMSSPEMERKKIFNRIDINVSDLKHIINKISEMIRNHDDNGIKWEKDLLNDVDKLKNNIINGFWKAYDLKNRPEDFKIAS